tara:strand:- start:11003 stop:11737 length:735 start_codon:yes stop_codon:yes gene_type:complete
MLDLPVYYVSRPADRARQVQMERQLVLGARAFERVEAPDLNFTRLRLTLPPNATIRDVDSACDHAQCMRARHESRVYSPREVQCTASHLAALSRAQRHRVALILEDDVDFMGFRLWTRRLAELVRRAPRDWEILQLHTPPSLYRPCSRRAYRAWDPTSWSTMAYVIRRRAMRRLLRLSGYPTGLRLEDEVLADLFLYSHAKTYRLTSPLMRATPFRSTIQPTAVADALQKEERAASEAWAACAS